VKEYALFLKNPGPPCCGGRKTRGAPLVDTTFATES